jgi:hypothetical protein
LKRVAVHTRDRGTAIGVGCAVVIALVAWPFRTVEPGVGGDWFWVSVLSYAAEHDLQFGEQLAWSYGPLGFLNTWYGPTLYYGDVLALSWLYAALVQLLLAGTLLAALRRSLPLVAAAIVAAIVLVFVPDRTVALGFGWCALMLARAADAPDDLAARAFAPALGVLAGLAALGKLNQGVELLAFAVVALVAAPRRRDALAFAGAFAATAALAWLLTGQALGDAWSYVRNSVEIVTGYAAAMGTSDPEHGWTLPVALALVAASLALAWWALRDAPPRRRWGFVALYVAYAGFTFKEGFVRQDVGHLEVFLGNMLMPFAMAPVRRARWPLLVGGLAVCVAALGALVGARDLARTVDPYANATAVGDQLRTLASPARREAVASRLREQTTARYGVSANLLAAIGRRPVMGWPFAYGDLAYAYDLDLRPLATIEPYAAYTPALDRLAAERLASADAPERILRAATLGIDGRHPSFEAPLAARAILCRYRELAVDGPWQVLASASDRCGSTRTLGTQTAAWGASVAVPGPRRPDALVLVRVEGAEPGGLELLRGLALRPRARWIELDGARHRVVAATAADGLLLSAPQGADYGGAHAMAPNPLRIAVGRDGGQPGGELSYTFEEVAIRPFAGSERAG